MGRQPDPFISLVEAARILGRTPEEVVSLCDEGLIRRRSTGHEVLVHESDVKEVHETNLNDLARPRDLVKDVMLLKREVRALRNTVDMLGDVFGMLSSSLEDYDIPSLVQLSETAAAMTMRDEWTLDELLTLSEVFLRMADSDILRLNGVLGVHDAWKTFYALCLKMCIYAREGGLPPGRDRDTAQVLLQRGLRNLRSIGVLFIENREFLGTSRDMLERTMSHDLQEYDAMMKQLKAAETGTVVAMPVQNR